MSALAIVAPGLQTTIQDRGRFGYQAFGVPISGALDSEAHEIANCLAGNPADAPCLEILYQGPTIEVEAQSVRVAVAGEGAEIELIGAQIRSLGGWRSLTLARGDRFRVRGLGTACAYIAVAGGFAIEPVLGSASTYVRGGFGGWQGRALRAGDRLPLHRDSAEERQEMALPAPPDAGIDRTIRIVLGPQQDRFTDRAIEALLGAEFKVSKQADRMGIRLDGALLAHRGDYNIVSDGIATGAIQVPGSGQPILLLADHQTTGGYPKIATVISADLPMVGRRRPGDRIRFGAVDVAAAERLRREQRTALNDMIATVVQAPPITGLDLERLHHANLISGVVFDT
jgi:biotin-dependent carboxylase-like uncharacterized protein